MTSHTIQPRLVFERPSLQRLRDGILRSAKDRKEAKRLYREAAKGGFKDEDLVKRSRALKERADKSVRELRVQASNAGLLDKLGSEVTREALRLPRVFREITMGEAWREVYALREAALAAWDGSPPTEYDAAMSLLFESEEWKTMDKARLKARDARRLKDGHWKSAKIRASKSVRDKARRKARSPEDVERDRLKARARHEARLEKKRESARRTETYGEMLEDLPAESQRAA